MRQIWDSEQCQSWLYVASYTDWYIVHWLWDKRLRKADTKATADQFCHSMYSASKGGPFLSLSLAPWGQLFCSSAPTMSLQCMLSWQQIASFTVYLVSSQRSTVETRSRKEKIAWWFWSPLPTLEMFSKKINASTCFSMQIAGLLKKKKKKMKKMKKKEMMRMVKLHRSGFSHWVLEGRMILLGPWIARYWPVSDLQLVLKPWPSILADFCGA